MNKKAIVFLLVFAMVIVACGDTTDEAAVEVTEEAVSYTHLTLPTTHDV